MSVRLTTSLSQRLVLTPQLRQRIEMLQMTSLELSELIQQQMTENPVLEEVATQEEARELAEKILDHMASGGEIDNFDTPRMEPSAPEVSESSSNGSGDIDIESFAAPESEGGMTGSEIEAGNAEVADDGVTDAARDPF